MQTDEKQDKNFFTTIVLTGGPCGGKTTAMADVAERLRSLGFQVFIQPEVATLLSVSGAGFPAGQSAQYMHGWEVERIKFQLAMEETFAGIAKHSPRPTVLLCDRGTGDAAAYHDAESWPKLAVQAVPEAQGNGDAACKLLVDRYDLVVHLTSAAIGAPDYYVKAGNSARRESAEEAVMVDHNIMRAWSTHRDRRVIDNSTDFSGKIRRVTTAICSHLGVLSPIANRRRFKVAKAGVHVPDDVSVEEFDIKYTFLVGSSEVTNTCIRERVQKGMPRSITCARKDPDGKITERVISSKEAKALMRDGGCIECRPFTRHRRAFVHADHYFELDDEDDDTLVLQVEAAAPNDTIIIPAWIAPAVVHEYPVIGQSHYNLFAVAKAQPKK